MTDSKIALSLSYKAKVIVIFALLSIILVLLFTNKNNRLPILNLTGLDGNRILIPEPGKKLNWINFWSASCAPCMKELPALEKFHLDNSDSSINIVTIAMSYDPPNIIKETQTRLNLTLPIALDLDGSASRHYSENMTIPSHYLLDSDSRILYHHQGALSEKEIVEITERFL